MPTIAHADVLELRDRIDRVLATRHREILDGVRKCIAEVLNIDETDIRADAVLTDDLGAESLDFLDLAFRLETAFGIKLPRGAIRQMVQSGLEGPFERNGRMTDEALERLRALMPEVAPASIPDDFSASKISDLFTVETFVRQVAWRHAA